MTEEYKYFTYIDTQTGKEDIKEIIIDGVNVAGCEYFAKQNEHSCLEENENCKNISNCYYKQLKRLEQENKELKNKNICRETCEYFKRICNENTLLIKYHSALEEIKTILNKECGVIGNAKAVGIINEVLNDSEG